MMPAQMADADDRDPQRDQRTLVVSTAGVLPGDRPAG